MSYFAEIDENGIVKRVIVADQNFIDSGAVGDPKNWKETFMDGSQRKMYASTGDTYNRNLDAFIPPKPYPSWVLDETTCKWKSPKERPDDTVAEIYRWNEKIQDWVRVPKDLI